MIDRESGSQGLVAEFSERSKYYLDGDSAKRNLGKWYRLAAAAIADAEDKAFDAGAFADVCRENLEVLENAALVWHYEDCEQSGCELCELLTPIYQRKQNAS